jgi:peptidyl-prolyl cis-trans isomerase SurA
MKKHLYTFALLGLLIAHVPATAEVLDYIVAVVNEEVIVNSQLQQELDRELKRWRKKSGRMPPRQFLKKQVLDRIIIEQLQLQVARDTGIQVQDSQLNETLRKIAAQKNMDLPSFRQQIEQEGNNYKQWREKAREQMMIELLQQRYVMNRITITDREIENFLATKTQQGTLNHEYHILHILIATPEAPSPEMISAKQQKAEEEVAKLKKGADFQATAVAISDGRQALDGGDLGWLKAGEMPTLFEGVVNQMRVNEIKGPLRDSSGFHIIKLVEKRGGQTQIMQTKARHILMKTSELMSDVEIEFRLKDIKSRIKLGEDFAKLAQAYSEDTGSAAEGGALGWVNPGELAAEFEVVMNSLSDNEISEPFKSRFGWHIVQVLERRKHGNTELARRNLAASQIHQRKVYEELDAWLKQLRDKAYIDYRIANLDNRDLIEE